MMLTCDVLSWEALAENGDAAFWSGMEQDRMEPVETDVFRNLCIKDIYAALKKLPELQHKVLAYIFGLGGQDKLSTQEIAWKFGENSAWVLLTARKALRRLRTEYGCRLEGYLGIAA
jgi:DNA-directed RNA polymerase sigma subunit (sigma70/sigma32)